MWTEEEVRATRWVVNRQSESWDQTSLIFLQVIRLGKGRFIFMLKWSNEDEIDPFDQAAVRQYLMDLESRFNSNREKLYYKVQSYFHQSIGSNYTHADDLRTMIDECEKIKKQYNDFKEHVREVRGTPYVI